ncbi:FadR/GntR family transcriptional regulator [Asanoa sp. NPDC049518]|uniref:FadR/GntR family transcriptional regulator n=1 Tax=unclassified Asanoa TaxID=2685164 RepID=UPI00341A1A5A
MSLTDRAIAQIRELIQTGELAPGAKLPPEAQLAAELGLGRNLLREAVKALEAARVLEVRHGSGTYVTSLEPRLLLEGVSDAVALLRGDDIIEVTEVRRVFEPAATAFAATRVTPADLAVLREHLDAMRASLDDVEKLNFHDAAFHRAVVAATGNETMTILLEGIANLTVRARVWRGLVDANVAERTVAEHEAILRALVARDAVLAHAAALMHVTTTETWLREHLPTEPPEPS